jgi:chaperonin GroES
VPGIVQRRQSLSGADGRSLAADGSLDPVPTIDPQTFSVYILLFTTKGGSMNVRPLHDRILVQRLEDNEEKSGGGIIIPDSAKEKPQRGKVSAVGNGKILDNGTRVELEVKKGDQVLFGKYAGTEVKIEGDEYLILREDDILAIVGK